jgi:hypothetical protein
MANWSISQIKGDLHMIAYECSWPGNDGYTAFELKKKLMEVKFLVEDLIEKCPTFVGEEEWLHERLMEKLKK